MGAPRDKAAMDAVGKFLAAYPPLHNPSHDTERYAADKLATFGALKIREMCLMMLYSRGVRGMTGAEAVKILRGSINRSLKESTVRTRFTELVDIGLARNSDERRDNDSGNPEIVRVLRPETIAALDQLSLISTVLTGVSPEGWEE
jgi:hypothetical protein